MLRHDAAVCLFFAYATIFFFFADVSFWLRAQRARHVHCINDDTGGIINEYTDMALFVIRDWLRSQSVYAMPQARVIISSPATLFTSSPILDAHSSSMASFCRHFHYLTPLSSSARC